MVKEVQPIKTQKKTGESKTQTARDKRCGKSGAPNWTGQHACPARIADCRICKRGGHYEKSAGH